MKKLWWLSRSTAVAAALYLALSLGSGSFQRTVKADEFCDTSSNCSVSAVGACYCGNGSGCTGCFVPNGSRGCGTCAGGSDPLPPVDP